MRPRYGPSQSSGLYGAFLILHGQSCFAVDYNYQASQFRRPGAARLLEKLFCDTVEGLDAIASQKEHAIALAHLRTLSLLGGGGCVFKLAAYAMRSAAHASVAA